MKNDILFREEQRFTQWWLWLILIGVNGLITFGVVTQLIQRKQFGDNPASNTELIIVLSLIVLLTLSFFMLKLETVIKKDGVYVKFTPFHFSYRHYSWNQILKSYVRQYNPIVEYGGWGLRGMGNNRALNVSGNQGLQLELEDNKKLLIGTRKPKEIEDILRSITSHT